MKKVLLVSLQKSGGVALDSLNLSNALYRSGFQHKVCASSQNEFRHSFCPIEAGDIIFVKTHGPRMVDFLISLLLLRPFIFLWKVIRANPDIVHVANFHPWILLLYVVHPFFKYTIMYCCHDNPFDPKEDHPLFMNALESWFARKADVVVAYSPFVKKEISGFVSKKIYILPLSIPIHAYGDFKNVHHFSDNPRLLFFGRIEPYKGLDTLVVAYRMLKDEKIQASLVVAGRGDIPQDVRESMDALGIRILNRWISNEELAFLLENTDIVVVPYKLATQSAVAATALSYTIPVIATDVGSLSDYVQDGYNGFLIHPDAPHEIVSCIKKIIKNKEALVRMSKNSARVREKFSPENVAAEAMRIYREL